MEGIVVRKYPDAHKIVKNAMKDNFQPIEPDESNILTFSELWARSDLDDLREYTARGLLTEPLKDLTTWLGGKGGCRHSSRKLRTSSRI